MDRVMRRTAVVMLLFIAAFVVTLVSVRFERVGPELVITGNVCGPTNNDACYAKVLKGGFPVAYLFDTPTVSRPNQLGFGEDDFRAAPFAVDVAAYLGILAFALRLSNRRKRHAPVAREAQVQ